MGDVLPFRRPPLADKAKGKTLCRNGFHKWAVVQDQIFDVKLGKLVTVYECQRCAATKTKLV